MIKSREYPILRKIFSRLKLELLYPVARVFVGYENLANRLRAIFEKDRLVLDKPYAGQPILLLALYEQGVLREDIVNLLKCVKASGVYVLCVNTSRLEGPATYFELMDGYIERYNHGRDFGSYRSGFLHINSRGWGRECPRLLLLNDSVFYTERGIKEFLAAMYETDKEVLGATENHEIEHHLGSFCLSLANSVLTHPAFKDYWRTYRNTDYRPAVIKKGEMALSRLLKDVVSSPQSIQALYNAASYMQALSHDQAFLEKSVELVRLSERVRWPRFDPKGFILDMLNRYGVVEAGQSQDEAVNMIEDRVWPGFDSVSDYESMVTVLDEWVKMGRARVVQSIREPLIGVLVSVFSQGSQIHQNAALLVHMGLPIVKLDGVYRGLFSAADVKRIAGLLNDSDAARLREQLLSKPYGGDCLAGWRQVAFRKWLI
jgi:hypothetical protein